MQKIFAIKITADQKKTLELQAKAKGISLKKHVEEVLNKAIKDEGCPLEKRKFNAEI